MKKKLFLILSIITGAFLMAQTHKFPQNEVNQLTSKVLKDYPGTPKNTSAKQMSQGPVTSVQTLMGQVEQFKKGAAQKMMSSQWVQIGDTIVVGATPNDTLFITGYWTHNGPILVLGDGVLIFKNATVIDTGDVYVFQNGKLFSDSSSLTFPQAYFYQRSLVAVQNATVQVAHTSFNYSGMSHNLVVGDSAHVTFFQIHQHDWTTCGLFSKPTLIIDSCNLAGEYILMDSCTAYFVHTDSLLLWHHVPMGANVTWTFPNGNNVNGYYFGGAAPGVNGIRYQTGADTCRNVWWALMPENGTNVNISNSSIRAIGTWFKYGDTANVQGLYDNSSYTNFTAPLSDRNLQLVNSNVQTWSLYVFDKSHIDVANCQVGEVGTEQKATVTQMNPFVLDGSGGYYWATDTSFIISFGAQVASYTRSEKHGVFIFAYGVEPYSAPQAIGNSVMICDQCYSPADPVYYDAATAWMNKIDGPDTSYTNMIVPVVGSAWIDWASGGNGWMDFQNYSVWYQLQGNSGWTKIVRDSAVELHHTNLANWNTNGLAAGLYNVKLTGRNNFGDTIEAVKQITLLQGGVGVQNFKTETAKIFPNPSLGKFFVRVSDWEQSYVEVYNVVGEKILSQKLLGGQSAVNVSDFSDGIYVVRVVKNGATVFASRILRE